MRRLDNWIDGYLEYNQDSEAHISYLTWTAISSIAAVLQRKVRLKWGFLTWYPNFYIVLVGPPAARKGTALGPAEKILTEVGIPMSADSTTRAQLICRLAECTDTIHEPKLGTIKNHSSLTIFSPEFTTFLGYNNLELMTNLTDWFDCKDKWTDETKTQGINEVHGVFVNILGATTPALIESSMPQVSIGSGLSSRMIFVCEAGQRRRNACPFFSMSPEGQKLYKDLVHDLGKIRQLQGDFKITNDYLDVYIKWYESMPKECPFDKQRFNPYWARRAMHLQKLALVLSAARSSDMIVDLQDFKRAKNLLEKTESKMPLAFSGMGRAREAQIISPVMAEIKTRGEVTFNELLEIFIRDTNDWELEKIIKSLVKIGFVKIKQSSLGTTITYNNIKENKDDS